MEVDERFNEHFNRMEADFGKLCQNRAKVPLDILQSRYAKAYNHLVEDLKQHIRDYIDDMAALKYPRSDSAGSQKANEWLEKQFERIKQEEQQPGKAYEVMEAGLIGDLDVNAFMAATFLVFDRMDKPYQKYWDAHCQWTGPPGRRWIYNGILKKFWLPEWPGVYPNGCWIKNDYSDPWPFRPPQIGEDKEGRPQHE
jgi:hypothetical protein